MDDLTLIQQFEDLTLPFDQWTHRTHVKVAFLYLREHGLDGGLERMRAGIKAYNAANDVPEGPDVGYHETVTVAFCRLIDVTMRAWGKDRPTPTADDFCDTHPQLMSPRVLRFFYSPRLGESPEAKICFVEPDLTDLPQTV